MPIEIDPTTGAPIVVPDNKEEVHVDSQTTGATNNEGTSGTDSSDGKESKESKEEVVSIPPVAPVLTHPTPPVPPVTAKVTAKVVKTEKEECLDKMNSILAEAGGLESNVGMTSEYWDLQRKYRSL